MAKPYFLYTLPLVFLVLGLGCSPEQTATPTPVVDTPAASTPVEATPAATTPEVIKEPHAGFVGSKACIACHVNEHAAWEDSHHDLAMQHANAETVLGDFSDITFEKDGVTSRFYKDGETFMVDTDGPDGVITTYAIAYTFGVDPLQQYLVEFPDGRMQVLGLCWDSRPASAGGQRWFHLYEDDTVPHTDILHWTGVYQNWNFMCAECHSTDLKKNYDPATDTFATHWAEMDVSCEACHGPGEEHLAWAETYDESSAESVGTMGLAHQYPANDLAKWIIEEGQSTAKRVPARTEFTEIESCAQCHSRRSQLMERSVPTQSIMETHLIEALEAPLYYDDGQIRDEVYVYGSFLQSKMYQHGVTCSDCHDPHSTRTRLPGNALCATCHLPTVYDTPKHHFHTQGTPGASCVECHMPETTYMVVDPRRDHSIRIPRPDLSVKLGSPNACNQCHTDQDATWAAEHVKQWYPDTEYPTHYGEDLALARSGAPEGLPRLLARVQDTETPDIVRATALSTLVNQPSQESVMLSIQLLHDASPMVRIQALKMMGYLPPTERWPLVSPLLEDPIGTVRHEAINTLAEVPLDSLNPEDRKTLKAAFDEWLKTMELQADRPDTHLNIGIFHYKRGFLEAAEKAYKQALKLEPQFAQARFNLADLYRAQRRDDEGEGLLKEGLRLDPEAWILHHALGLLLHRRGESNASLTALAKAAHGAPEDARFQYVYAIALNSAGRSSEALFTLENAMVHHPNAMDMCMALVSINMEMGLKEQAAKYLKRMQERWPNAQETHALTQQLETL